MATTVGIVNQKGGVGKTTTCVNLAGVLVSQGFRVLVLDFDPQGSASPNLGATTTGEALRDALFELRRLSDQVLATPSGIDLIPGGPALSDFLEANRRAKEKSLLKALGTLPSDLWDFILVDAPPRDDSLSWNVLVASDAVLVPVEAKFQSLAPLVRVFDAIEELRRDFGRPAVTAGILPTRVTRTRMSRDVIAALRSRFGDLVFEHHIRESTQIAEAPGGKEVITTHSPHSLGAADYRAATAELLHRLGVERQRERAANE